MADLAEYKARIEPPVTVNYHGYDLYSCRPVIPGAGLYLSRRGGQSKLQDGHPASVAPGKRPRLTPAPALVLRDGQPVMALGAHGGDHIPQGTLQTFLNVVEFGLDTQEAVEAARFYSYNFPSSGFPWANRPGRIQRLWSPVKPFIPQTPPDLKQELHPLDRNRINPSIGGR